MHKKTSNTLGFFLFLIFVPIHTQGMDREKTNTTYTASSKDRNNRFPIYSSPFDCVSDIPVCDLTSHINLDGIDLKQMTNTQEQQSNNTVQPSTLQSSSTPKRSKKLEEMVETEFRKPQKREKFILGKESLEIQTLCQSCRASQVLFERKLYQNAIDTDPNFKPEEWNEYIKSKEYEEAQINRNYYVAHKKDTVQIPFTIQSLFEKLRNEVDPKMIEWDNKRLAELREYRHAYKEMKNRETAYEKKYKKIPDIACEEETTEWREWKLASKTYNTLHTNFLKKHAPLAVITGERNLTQTEKQAMDDRIFNPKTVITWKPLLSSSANGNGTAYLMPPTQINTIKSFLLNHWDLEIELAMLKNKNERMEREVNILKFIENFFLKDVKPQLEQWGNWLLEFNQIIAGKKLELQKQIDEIYPLPVLPGYYTRDWNTDKGVVLARLNKDERGQFIRDKIYFKIQ